MVTLLSYSTKFRLVVFLRGPVLKKIINISQHLRNGNGIALTNGTVVNDYFTFTSVCL